MTRVPPPRWVANGRAELTAIAVVVRQIRVGDHINTSETIMIVRSLLLAAIALPFGEWACAFAAEKGAGQSGIAAVYSYKGGRTASGETAQPDRMTAAHRSLPFGTMVRVTNRRNGRVVVVRINDRGPFTPGRVIDLTPAAAGQLGFTGLVPVTLDVVSRQ